MDIELARTFLEIATAGTLSKAAERLHLTQATISARLQKLEAELGSTLFVRNKGGTRLTALGEQFIPYATQLTQTWAQAQRSLGLPTGMQSTLKLGGEFSLWSALLLNWLVALRKSRHEVALRAHVDSPMNLLGDVERGQLDMAVLYSPLRRPGVSTRLVLEEELVAVTTDPKCRKLVPSQYVYVDWGPDFVAQHDHALPELRAAPTYSGLGPLALRYLLKVGGSGYFRTRAVEPYVQDGSLHRIPRTPTFSYSLYAIHSERADLELVTWAHDRLAAAASEAVDSWA
jgi:LysR family transcriptional regulator, flagellar master operon regulator